MEYMFKCFWCNQEVHYGNDMFVHISFDNKGNPIKQFLTGVCLSCGDHLVNVLKIAVK